MAAEAGNADLLGSRLIPIDGNRVADVRTILRSFSGGTVAHRDAAAAHVLTAPEQLRAVGLSSADNSVTYGFVTPGGRDVQRRFALSPPGSKPWKQIPAEDRAPWALQEPEKLFRYRDAPEINGVIAQLRITLDAEDEKIADFLQKVETQRKRFGRRKIVLDMRDNNGGNFYLTRDFMSQWPAHVPGKFYVLTSRGTFSAAITSIAYLKQAGGGAVKVIGEPVGDRLVFFSDGLPIQLPRSGRFFQTAVVRMDYQDGCRKYADCSAPFVQPGRPRPRHHYRVPQLRPCRSRSETSSPTCSLRGLSMPG